MFGRLILLIAFLIAAVTILQLLKKTPKSQLKNLYWKLGLGSVAVILVLLAITGRIHWISAVIGAMLPFARRTIPLLIRFLPMLQHYIKTRQRPTPSSGNSSHVQTTILSMILDHDSNQLTGDIISGPYAGKNLDQLDVETLREVLSYCTQHDQDSAKLLVSYLNHRFGDSWQGTAATSIDEKMDKQSALAILGLQEGASKKEIVQAHRKIMQKVHPDHGGSDYLAAQINQAKDLLIKDLT